MMRTAVITLSILIGFGVSAQTVLASSSISTRVKVVEEKIRLHDKKLRELSAQQALTNKEIALLKQARLEAEKAMQEKAEADKKAAQVKLAAQRARAVQAKMVAIEQPAYKKVTKQHSDPATYAYP